jgi:rsbT co-antagonist protein RsbR
MDQLTHSANLTEIADFALEQRKRFVDLQNEDIARIIAVKDMVLLHAAEHAGAFFTHLSTLPEAADLFRNRNLLEQAKRRKQEHLAAMAGGQYDRGYVEQRIELGVLYSKAQLDVRIFLGAFHCMMRSISAKILMQFEGDAQTAFDHLTSLNKIAFFDIGIIIDVLIAERERTIRLQQEAIRELSTPALQIRDRLLILPIIGMLDSNRARQLTENLLSVIRANRAKVVVMDITGVATVDSKVANHLLQTVAASRLMGATVIVTGLSAEVAQSLVTLGVDLSKLNAIGDLQGGLEEAERMLGYSVVRGDGAQRQQMSA